MPLVVCFNSGSAVSLPQRTTLLRFKLDYEPVAKAVEAPVEEAAQEEVVEEVPATEAE